MTLTRYSALIALASLWLAPQAISASSPPVNRDKIWAQSYSDVPVDPAVRFGTLPNGMRYAVMRNATPAKQASLRLRIGSGSLEENDAQQGLAHFLEHMSFKGSVHVPEGEMMKILQRKGLAFGPDTNASTSWDQTVFMLDLPETDADSLDTGLMLMRETAGELTLSASALEPERGVVLSEERLRDTPQYRAEVAQIDLLLEGQLATKRWPIGKVDVLKHAQIGLLKEYYQANYRPDRATIIAVGDFDPVEMEGKIVARFADWKPVGPEVSAPDLGTVKKRGLTAKIVELPGTATRVRISWVRPYDDAPDMVAKQRKDIIDALGVAVLNRRLDLLEHAQHPPFLNASGVFEDLLKSAKIAVLSAQSSVDNWQPALEAIDQEQRRIVQFGIGKDELNREIVEWRTKLQNAVKGSATRRTPALASGLVMSVSENSVFTSPAQDLAIFDKSVAGLNVDDVNAAVRNIFAGSSPLLELTTPQKIDGGEATLIAAYQKAQAVKLSPPVAETALTWPYTKFGKTGIVAERHEIADLGTSAVTFENGVRLAVKPTKLRDEQVLVGIRVANGRLDLPLDRPNAAWALRAFVPGGLGAISQDDMERVLVAKIYNIGVSMGDDAFRFHGSTRAQDLDTELQVLTAYMTDPGFRPEAFERNRTAAIDALAQIDSTPNGVLSRDLSGLLHVGDTRWAFPSRAQLVAAQPDDLKALLQGPLSTGQIEITIVGDVTVDQAIDLAAATFGTLPKRTASPVAAAARDVHFPPGSTTPVALVHKGRADQAIAFIGWPMTDVYADLAQTRVLNLTDDILQNRIIDKVRIADGATYSPHSALDLSESFPGYGYGFSMVETPPAKIPDFYATIATITADMRDVGVTEDELTRAKNPRIERIKKAQLTNEYWLEMLSGSLSDPRRLAVIRTTFPDYEKVTVADVKQAAVKYFTDEAAWKLTVKAGTVATGN